ncbi:MAG: hypothetical protein WA728_26105, partial [Xanthobacteraceae bacterium]
MSDHIQALKHVSSGSTATARLRDRLAVPFYFVEPAVLAVDFVLLVAVSVATGIGYHWIFRDYMPDVGPYIAIGAL